MAPPVNPENVEHAPPARPQYEAQPTPTLPTGRRTVINHAAANKMRTISN